MCVFDDKDFDETKSIVFTEYSTILSLNILDWIGLSIKLRKLKLRYGNYRYGDVLVD